MNCTVVSLLKPIWMDFLVYTRNSPDLTCHAFNNQSHKPLYTQIISCELYWKYTTLHCCCNTETCELCNCRIPWICTSYSIGFALGHLRNLSFFSLKNHMLETLFFHRFRTIGSLQSQPCIILSETFLPFS